MLEEYPRESLLFIYHNCKHQVVPTLQVLVSRDIQLLLYSTSAPSDASLSHAQESSIFSRQKKKQFKRNGSRALRRNKEQAKMQNAHFNCRSQIHDSNPPFDCKLSHSTLLHLSIAQSYYYNYNNVDSFSPESLSSVVIFC